MDSSDRNWSYNIPSWVMVLMIVVRVISWGWLELVLRFVDESRSRREAFELYRWSPSREAYWRIREWKLL